MAYFDKLVEDGEVTPARPRGVSFQHRKISKAKRLDWIILLTLPQAEQEHQNKATLTTKGPVEEMICSRKSDWPMEERLNFYDILSGQVLR